MTAQIGVPAGSAVRIRTQITREEMRRRPEHAWFGPVVSVGPDRFRLENVAFIEAVEAEGMKKSGWRHLTLWAETARMNVIAVVDTEAADGRRMVYRVLDASGAVLARVERVKGSVIRFRRTRWTLDLAGGPTLRAVKGSVFGWCMWWALSPLWALLAVAVLLGGDFPRMPLKTVFKGDRGESFRFSGVEGTDHTFKVAADWPDPRVVLAATALHDTHSSWRDRGTLSREQFENGLREDGIVRP